MLFFFLRFDKISRHLRQVLPRKVLWAKTSVASQPRARRPQGSVQRGHQRAEGLAIPDALSARLQRRRHVLAGRAEGPDQH